MDGLFEGHRRRKKVELSEEKQIVQLVQASTSKRTDDERVNDKRFDNDTADDSQLRFPLINFLHNGGGGKLFCKMT